MAVILKSLAILSFFIVFSLNIFNLLYSILTFKLFLRIKKCGSNSKTIAIVWRCRYCLKRKFWNNSFRTYINGRLIHEGDSNLPIITVAGNLNIRRERSMSNQTRGRGLVLHFDGSHWILREGRSRQQMSLYPVVIFHRRKIAFIMHEFWKLN